MRTSGDYDLLCLSHLRWDFVFQRPQHLLSRCARERRVLFVEEPMFDAASPRLDITQHADGVEVLVPRLPADRSGAEYQAMQRKLLDTHLRERQSRRFVLWYYTPMMLAFTDHLQPLATVYDCMDELANFHGAPPSLRELEAELFRRADLVFTGGRSLWEHKRLRHPSVHCFPSSVDVPHFASARERTPERMKEPADQEKIPHPRLGFFGVIDERMDLALLDAVARARPDWQLVMIGPVVKIDPARLPRRSNIHWLGGKSYRALPGYIVGWDVALLPFAQNDATRFISPTKTPEYLAAGKPVVSTPITDVVRPYGEMGLAHIAKNPAEFVFAVERALCEDRDLRQRLADGWLSHLSWDRTWSRMHGLIADVIAQRAPQQQQDLALGAPIPGRVAAENSASLDAGV